MREIIRERNKTKENEQMLKNKMEDIFLNLVLLLPEQLIPDAFMEKYFQKRKAELEAEQVNNAWRKVDLEIARKVISAK